MTRVDFIKGGTTRYRSVLHRPDGVVVELDGGSYNKLPEPVPHDIAHLIVEGELGLTQGVWGTLVAGGLFKHTTVIAGRQKPHARERGRALVAAAHDTIMEAELRTRAVCDGRADGIPPGAFERCRTRLRAAAAAWAALPADGVLSEEWT